MGDVRTARQLDRETHGGDFVITVVAVEEEGEVSKTSTCEVNLTVENVNTTPSVFEDISTIRFSKDTNPGVPLTQVQAYDSDVDNVIKYSIVDSDKVTRRVLLSGSIVTNLSFQSQETFAMDKMTGDISLLNTVDREARETYWLDRGPGQGDNTNHGSPLLSTNMEIRINVLDNDENTPRFEVYNMTVLENATISQNILHTKAFDSDLSLNGEIRYTGQPAAFPGSLLT